MSCLTINELENYLQTWNKRKQHVFFLKESIQIRLEEVTLAEINIGTQLSEPY